MNSKVSKALDQRDTGDLIHYFHSFDNIIEKNSGLHDNKLLSIDSSEPPCPVKVGQYTKLKLTDESIGFTNIDKSSITCDVQLKLQINGFTSHMLTIPGASDVTRVGCITSNRLSNAMTKLFVGFKSAIHVFDAYRVYSNNKKTQCEQTEALYENSLAYMMKTEQEVQAHPYSYTPYEHARTGSDCVCGTYISLEDFDSKSEAYQGNVMTIHFEVNIPLDDFLPFQAMTIFPNAIFGNLYMEVKQAILGNLVYCQVDPDEAKKNYLFKCGPKVLGDDAPMDFGSLIGYDHRFSQINDPYDIDELCFTNDKQPIVNHQTITLQCTDGQLLTCRSNINGFNVRETVIDELAEYYRNTPLVIPSQFVDYQAFSQVVQPNGLKCNTTYNMCNATNIVVTFPRTGNQITCSQNPQFGSIQVQIDCKPYPDKPFSTLEAAHSEYILTNSGLDSLWAPQKDFVYSINFNELTDSINDCYCNVDASGIAGNIQSPPHMCSPKSDNTNYCFNVATERISGNGVFCDGLTKSNTHISLNATNLNSTTLNHYLYPDGTTRNTCAPMMMIVQDTFWECYSGQGCNYIINNRDYTDYHAADANEEIEG